MKLLPPSQKASVKANQSENNTYRIQANLVRNQSVIETETRRAGRFVLAINVIDITELSNDKMLREYKGQQSAERGFSFLKDISLYPSTTTATSSLTTITIRNQESVR